MAIILQSTSGLLRQYCNFYHDMVDNSKLSSIKKACSVGLSLSSLFPTKSATTTRILIKERHCCCTLTDTSVVATEPLTKEDLINHLVSGCKPKNKWRIGTEHEKFGFEMKTLRPIKYEQIAELLNGIAEEFDWNRVMEGYNVVGLKKGKKSITLEPSGQLEFSDAPVETLHQACAEIDSHLYQVKEIAEDMGIGFLGMGFDPKWNHEDMTTMPMGRFQFIKEYLPKVGSLGMDIFFRSCTVQVNLDFSSEIDMIKKFRASLALQPIAVALFANSPFKEGKPNGYLSMRSKAWTETDDSRTGMLPIAFENSFGFERYVDYALDVPMIFVRRQNRHIDCGGKTFRDFMAGKLERIPGETPTITDWECHLGTIYTEVRLRRYLEMRGADGGPLSMLHALPAFWVGLLYDEISLQNVLDMIADWTRAERQMLRDEVPKTGLKTPFRGELLSEVAKDVVKWAKVSKMEHPLIEGLERRGLMESGYLNEIIKVATTGETLAERHLDKYYGKWGQCVDPLYEELIF
nr:glutamate--cysteine ligase, chloroplastic-like isoform X1 [Ziziphus jujuba var. spinosa]